MVLASNDVTDEGVTQLVKVCNGRYDNLLNHTHAAPLRVARNALQITSSGVC